MATNRNIPGKVYHYSDDRLYMPGKDQTLLFKRRAICGDIIAIDGKVTDAFKGQDPDAYWTATRGRVTCPECIIALRQQEPGLRSGTPQVVYHYAPSYQAATTHCGINVEDVALRQDEYWTSIKTTVTCQMCLDMIDNEVSVDRQDDAEWGDDIEPKAEDPELRVHREDSAKQERRGMFWPHDCDQCAYLGSESWDGWDFDLHWCPLSETPIARYGRHGNYFSGMGFITTQPMLALAYCRALHRGLVQPGVI